MVELAAAERLPTVITGDRQLSYRETITFLRLYEPRRSTVTVVTGLVLMLSAPAIAVSGVVVGGYVGSDFHQPIRVIAGALILLGFGQLSHGVWRRQAWRRLATRRLAVYSAYPTGPDGSAWALVGDTDVDLVWRVLARAGLWTGNRANLGAAPSDAPTLRNRVFITRADALRKPDPRGAGELARGAFRTAGIRARVDNVDVP
jgi:hypothetical protein